MTPSTATRLRLALLTLAFVGALALTGVIVQKPRGGSVEAVPAGIRNGWPVKYLGGAVSLSGIIVQGGVPR